MKLELISTVRKFQDGGKSEKKEKQDKGEMLGYKKLYNTTTQLSEERLKEAADEGIRSNMSMMNAAINSGKIGDRKLGKSEIKSLKAAVKHLTNNPTQYRFDTKTKEIQPIDSETGEVKRSRTGAGELLQKIFKGKSDDEVPTKNESKRLNEANAILKYFNTTKDYVGKKQTEQTTPTEEPKDDGKTGTFGKQTIENVTHPIDVKPATTTDTKPVKPNNNTGRRESEASKLAGKQRSDMFNSWRNYPELQDMYRKLWNEGGGVKANQEELHKAVLGKLYNNQMIDGSGKYISSTENIKPLGIVQTNLNPLTVDATRIPTTDTDVYGRSKKPQLGNTVLVGSKDIEPYSEYNSLTGTQPYLPGTPKTKKMNGGKMYQQGGINMSKSNTQNDMKQSLKFGGNLKSSDNNLKKKS